MRSLNGAEYDTHCVHPPRCRPPVTPVIAAPFIHGEPLVPSTKPLHQNEGKPSGFIGAVLAAKRRAADLATRRGFCAQHQCGADRRFYRSAGGAADSRKGIVHPRISGSDPQWIEVDGVNRPDVVRRLCWRNRERRPP